MMVVFTVSADPVHFGKYPPAMVARLGSRLPTFTQEQSALLIRTGQAMWFFGLNGYVSDVSLHCTIA